MKQSTEIEKYTIVGILKYPDIISEIASSVDESFYDHPVFKACFKVCKQRYTSKQPINGIIIADSLKRMGVSFSDGLEVSDFLDSLYHVQLSKKGGMDYFQELKTMHLRKEIFRIGTELRKISERYPDLNEVELLGMANEAFNKKLSLQNVDLRPEDLFANTVETIETLALNPVEESGIPTPYPTFNRFFGGLLDEEIYAFLSRPGHGKSTILNDMAHKIALNDDNVKVLILDTEMPTQRMRMRKAAAVTGIPLWYLKTGKFMGESAYKKIWYAKKDEFKKLENRISHIHVPGVEIQRVLSMARRWRYGHIKADHQPIVIYDYIKLTGEEDAYKKEYQLIGEKLNSLKLLCSELKAPFLTACQLNRSAEGKHAVDDSSAIAQSDRLQWFAAFVGIFRRKTPDQLQIEGKKFGTHALIPLKEREQGRDAKGHKPFIEIPNLSGKGKKSVINHLCFEVDNFNVEDRGCLEDALEAAGGTLEIPEDKGEAIEF